jgi:hypothetical protein
LSGGVLVAAAAETFVLFILGEEVGVETCDAAEDNDEEAEEDVGGCRV